MVGNIMVDVKGRAEKLMLCKQPQVNDRVSVFVIRMDDVLSFFAMAALESLASID